MKGVYNYYVTYVSKNFFTNPFGISFAPVDLSKIIHGINISFSEFRLYNTYRMLEDEDGEFDIDATFIKNEVCEALWDRKYENEYKKHGLDTDKLYDMKMDIIKSLSDDIIIIAWSETKVGGEK